MWRSWGNHLSLPSSKPRLYLWPNIQWSSVDLLEISVLSTALSSELMIQLLQLELYREAKVQSFCLYERIHETELNAYINKAKASDLWKILEKCFISIIHAS